MTVPSSHLPLADRVALVTGASRGIGGVTAQAFADAGAAVVLAARDAAALTEVAQSIRDSGGHALAVPTDIGDEDAVAALLDRAVRTFGRLDIAFNNAAGGSRPMRLADVPIDGYDAAERINARGLFLCLKYQLTAMVASGGGAIVNMSSTAGLRGVGGLAAYGPAKAAVIAMTQVAALDYAPAGVRVNAVAPGPILTHHLERAGDEAQRMAAQAVALGRLGRPEEVAAAVVWLCSDAASYITGVTLPIDGGQTAGMGVRADHDPTGGA